ncbi:hypothetical protein [Mesorhizobium sp. WSM4904]|uniref:hypothetical protein n=1 Tax=Mesorhizobium sp. WSM4904 TaxID=3038545 RepID=UPI00241893DE|nr:hypothetical protein [Mesorhizobium sp. WSM4904]WFP63855.1 hypothetical protein QAZ47_04540 [Mesorhizobium sp. WSM4904]
MRKIKNLEQFQEKCETVFRPEMRQRDGALSEPERSRCALVRLEYHGFPWGNFVDNKLLAPRGYR